MFFIIKLKKKWQPPPEYIQVLSFQLVNGTALSHPRPLPLDPWTSLTSCYKKINVYTMLKITPGARGLGLQMSLDSIFLKLEKHNSSINEQEEESRVVDEECWKANRSNRCTLASNTPQERSLKRRVSITRTPFLLSHWSRSHVQSWDCYVGVGRYKLWEGSFLSPGRSQEFILGHRALSPC